MFSDDRAARERMLERLADALDAAPVQHIGKLLVLWRPPPPKDAGRARRPMPGPKVVKLIKFSKSGNHRPQVKKVTVLGNLRAHRRRRAQARETSAPGASRSRPEG